MAKLFLIIFQPPWKVCFVSIQKKIQQYTDVVNKILFILWEFHASSFFLFYHPLCIAYQIPNTISLWMGHFDRQGQHFILIYTVLPLSTLPIRRYFCLLRVVRVMKNGCLRIGYAVRFWSSCLKGEEHNTCVKEHHFWSGQSSLIWCIFSPYNILTVLKDSHFWPLINFGIFDRIDILDSYKKIIFDCWIFPFRSEICDIFYYFNVFFVFFLQFCLFNFCYCPILNRPDVANTN